MTVVNVIDSICVKTESRLDYLAVLKANVPSVIKEEGGIEYIPMIVIDAKLPPQVYDKNVVTIFEKRASLGNEELI
jgi:quinol monooxygenase YgiN